jgi:hypothetical protein
MASIVPYFNPQVQDENTQVNSSERLLDRLIVEMTGKALSPHEEFAYIEKILALAMPQEVARMEAEQQEEEEIPLILPLMPTSVH